MKINKIDGLLVEIELAPGQSCSVATVDLIAGLIATVGPEHWLEDLTSAHMTMAHALFKSNFPDVGTEPYDPSDLEAGVRLENLCGEISNALLDLRDRLAEQNGNTKTT